MIDQTRQSADDTAAQRLRQHGLIASFASFALMADRLEPVLQEACRTASQGLRCPLAKVLEYLPNEDVLLMRAGVGWRPDTVGVARLGADLESPAGFAFRTGQSVLSNQLADENRFRTPRLLLEHGVRQAFNVPIGVPGRRYGVLEADSPDGPDFEVADTAFLQTLASLLGHAIARDAQQRAIEQASEAKDLLMLEVHHRVKNSLQLVQNLLTLQSRSTQDETAAAQLNESASRVHTIGAIHDRLYRTGTALTVEVGPYLEGLVEDLRAGMASTLEDRPIVVRAERADWPATDMPALGLVLTELVTNALKYGRGTIRVSFAEPAGSDGVLVVEDEGRDLPADFDPSRSRGLGMRLANGLLRGQGAGLSLDRSVAHTRFVARLPPTRTEG